uniref:Uncharacterized protein n=1 Tax=Heterorhabditis bacteriophora TaxID=37862 RepID=A0A1I7X362_HETBA
MRVQYNCIINTIIKLYPSSWWLLAHLHPRKMHTSAQPVREDLRATNAKCEFCFNITKI